MSGAAAWSPTPTVPGRDGTRPRVRARRKVKFAAAAATYHASTSHRITSHALFPCRCVPKLQDGNKRRDAGRTCQRFKKKHMCCFEWCLKMCSISPGARSDAVLHTPASALIRHQHLACLTGSISHACEPQGFDRVEVVGGTNAGKKKRRTLSNCLSKIVSMKRLFFEPFELKIYFFEIYNPNFGVHVTI